MDTSLSSTQMTDLLVLQQLSWVLSQESTTNQSVKNSLGKPADHWKSFATHRLLQFQNQQCPTGVQLLPLDRLTSTCLTVFHRANQRMIHLPQPIPWTTQWTQEYLTVESVLEHPRATPKSMSSLKMSSLLTQEMSTRMLHWHVIKGMAPKVLVFGSTMSLLATGKRQFTLCTLCAVMVRITILLLHVPGTSVTLWTLSAPSAQKNGMQPLQLRRAQTVKNWS